MNLNDYLKWIENQSDLTQDKINTFLSNNEVIVISLVGWRYLDDVSCYNSNYYQDPKSGTIICEDYDEYYNCCYYYLCDNSNLAKSDYIIGETYNVSIFESINSEICLNEVII